MRSGLSTISMTMGRSSEKPEDLCRMNPAVGPESQDSAKQRSYSYRTFMRKFDDGFVKRFYVVPVAFASENPQKFCLFRQFPPFCPPKGIFQPICS